MRPAKTHISLGIRPVRSESSLCAFGVAKDPIILHADSEDSDQCRQNDYSDNFKVFSSFESSIMAFENIFGSDYLLMNTVLLKILIVCIQIGSVRNRWKFAVAKWIDLAL